MWSLTTVRDGVTHNDKLATVQFANIANDDRNQSEVREEDFPGFACFQLDPINLALTCRCASRRHRRIRLRVV
jgi:hypothetical protein